MTSWKQRSVTVIVYNGKKFEVSTQIMENQRGKITSTDETRTFDNDFDTISFLEGFLEDAVSDRKPS